ncbi:MAG: cupin domain-containing protein [Dehalococcoidia bacterium]
MQVTRIDDAKAYEAPNHFDVRSLRLQGWDASDTSSFWVGVSYFLPDGGTGHEATPFEKVYVVIDGEITVITDGGEAVLGPLDSCHIPANEARSIRNRTNKVATMLVIMPYPPEENR